MAFDDLGFVKEYLHSKCEERIQILESAMFKICAYPSDEYSAPDEMKAIALNALSEEQSLATQGEQEHG
jgi:hypothetical protein